MNVDLRERSGAPQRLVVGISGASGTVYGLELLKTLRSLGLESHLVVSKAGDLTVAKELGLKPASLRALASYAYAISDVGAAIASGSFKTLGMIIAPCSVHTMSQIASGLTSTLLTRAADVVLKERRRLVLMVRETPFHAGHLRTMLALTEMGAIIAPPLPAFYAQPQSVDDLVHQSVGRVLDLFGISVPGLKRWGESPTLAPNDDEPVITS